MIITFLVGSLFGLIGQIGSDAMSLISYIVSEDNLDKNGTGGDNILVGSLGEAKGYLYRCINAHINYKFDPFNKKSIPYSIGIKKTFWSFTSTTPDLNTSLDFLGKKSGLKIGTIFTLCGDVWGYDITLFN